MIRRNLIRAAGVAIAAFTARALGQTGARTAVPAPQLAFLDVATAVVDPTKVVLVAAYNGQLVPVSLGANVAIQRDSSGTLSLASTASGTNLTLGVRATSTDGIVWSIPAPAPGNKQAIKAVYRNGLRQAVATDYNTNPDLASITILPFPALGIQTWNVNDIVQFDLY